jgi:glycerol 2-dehydrogenase (NADP+)
MRKYCAEHDIVLTAYSPLGRPMPGQNLPTFLGDEPVKGIASRLGATEAQVVLSWGVQQGVIVVPKSENPDRMKANITVGYKLLVLLHSSDLSFSSFTWSRPTSRPSTASISRAVTTAACSAITRRMARSSDTHTSSLVGT